MPWGRCDDTFYRHPKVGEMDDGLRKGCIAAYWMAISWSNDHLTDGRVPVGTLRTLGVDRDEADELVRVGLWEQTGAAYLVHDWADFNKTKAQVLTDRAQRSAAGRVSSIRRWRASGNESLNGSSNGSLNEMPNESLDEPTNEMDAPYPVPRTPITRTALSSQKGPASPRQIVHSWLMAHGTAAPVGWVNTSLNELVKVYGPDRIVALWDQASPDVRTSKQFVQLAEQSLAPGRNGSPAAS